MISTAVTQVEQWLQNFRHLAAFWRAIFPSSYSGQTQEKGASRNGICMCNEHLNEEKLKSDSPRVTQEKSALRNRRHFNDQCTIQYFQRRWIDGVEKSLLFRRFIPSQLLC